jgi:hypothetical protein
MIDETTSQTTALFPFQIKKLAAAMSNMSFLFPIHVAINIRGKEREKRREK